MVGLPRFQYVVDIEQDYQALPEEEKARYRGGRKQSMQEAAVSRPYQSLPGGPRNRSMSASERKSQNDLPSLKENANEEGGLESMYSRQNFSNP